MNIMFSRWSMRKKAMKYSCVLFQCLVSYSLRGMEASRVLIDKRIQEIVRETGKAPQSYHDLLVKDVQQLVKNHLIEADPEFFKALMPPRPYRMLKKSENSCTACVAPDGSSILLKSDQKTRTFTNFEGAKERSSYLLQEVANPTRYLVLKANGLCFTIENIQANPSELLDLDLDINSHCHAIMDLADTLQCSNTVKFYEVNHDGFVFLTSNCEWALTADSRSRTLVFWDLEDMNSYTLDGYRLISSKLSSAGTNALSTKVRGEYEVANYSFVYWDLGDREKTTFSSDHTGCVTAKYLTPDGNWFVICASDKFDRMIVLSDTRDPRIVYRIKLDECKYHLLPVILSAIVTPDCQWAIIGAYKEVIVCDLRNKSSGSIITPYARLVGDIEQIIALHITPDGNWVIGSAAASQTLVWNLQNKEAGTIEPYFCLRHKSTRNWVKPVYMTPNARRAITSSEELGTAVWDLYPLDNLSLSELTLLIPLKDPSLFTEEDREFYGRI